MEYISFFISTISKKYVSMLEKKIYYLKKWQK